MQEQKNAEEKKEEGVEEKQPQDLSAKGEALKDEMDSLIDEIDEAIEATLEGTDASQWVASYVQRGGE